MKYGWVTALAALAVAGGGYYFYHQRSAEVPGAAADARGRGGPGGFGGPQQLPLVTIGEVRREQLYDTVEAIGTPVWAARAAASFSARSASARATAIS